LRNIACAARDLKKYVVVNLYMLRNCEEEHEREHGDEHEHSSRHHDDGHEEEHECTSEWLLYNTNVVFDRNGKVISIYRKFNLFGEPGISVTHEADYKTFSTDFGVTFGHFICFDLMFQSPAYDLVIHDIKNIIFPTMWFSELPFLTAVQIQQNWAHANDVNFLGAGANNPAVGSGGSGIYSGKSGALISTMTGQRTTALLVHEVPKIPGNPVPTNSPAYSGSDFDNLELKRDKLDVYNFKKINLPESTLHDGVEHNTFKLCQTSKQELCCDFDIDVSLKSVATNTVPYTYYAAIFNGIRSFDGFAEGHIETCAVIACQNDSISTCGIMYKSSDRFESNVVFEKIVIKATFPVTNFNTLPTTLNFNVSPYPTSDYSFQETSPHHTIEDDDTTKDVTISLLTPKTDLYTFGIYCRNYRSSGSKVTSTILVLLAGFVFKFLVG